MKDEVWVLGATGRTARMIAARLHEAQVPLVLVGRDRGRLEGAAAELGGTPRLVVGTSPAVLDELARGAPGVVLNTVGPFTDAGAEVARACPPGTHYVDVANELTAVQQILDLDARAASRNQVLVTGAGFGVLASESTLLRVCEGRPAPAQVRVDAIASVALEASALGTVLAGTIVEVLMTGGREVRGGRLVRSRTGTRPERLTTPDGDIVQTAGGANGELIAAWRASQADTVVAASSMAPTATLVRLALPAVEVLVRLPGVGRFATARLAPIKLRAADRPRPSSWAHARAEWADGKVRDGWLRTGDGMDFTAAAAAEVVQRLLRGEGRPGAHTPGALFGAGLAEVSGGEFVLDPAAPAPVSPSRDRPGRHRSRGRRA